MYHAGLCTHCIALDSSVQWVQCEYVRCACQHLLVLQAHADTQYNSNSPCHVAQNHAIRSSGLSSRGLCARDGLLGRALHLFRTQAYSDDSGQV